MNITRVGVDIAKSVFHIHAVDRHHKLVWQAELKRDQWLAIVDEIPWRGVEAFGDSRKWNEIAYPEALGLAREALQKAPDDPVDYIYNVFDLQRRYESILNEFRDWISVIKQEKA